MQETIGWQLIALAVCMLFEYCWPDLEPGGVGYQWSLQLAFLLCANTAVNAVLGTELSALGSLFQLEQVLPRFLSIFVCFACLSLVIYWTHRWRHQWNGLWRFSHQLHHVSSRMVPLAGAYLHPIDVAINVSLFVLVSSGVFGLSFDSIYIIVIIRACNGMFMHSNIKTPYWMGYFLVRPEMHKVHHRLGDHSKNFAEIPLWDILFGTYCNPRVACRVFGTDSSKGQSFWRMLACRKT